jgi:glycyl-tRNA synthetase beta chain
VSGLVEWPVVLMGEFDESFLYIPPEVIQLTIRENQKCFVLKSASNGSLVNRFLLVSNIVPSDGGLEVARGNGKVVNARLADAKFFWDSDLTQIASNDGFSPWIEKLDSVTFHAKLGTQGERVRRIMALAQELAVPIASSGAKSGQTEGGNDFAALAKRAAELCKADLNSAMVYEFPEVQGLMGHTYALRAGENKQVAAAIEAHYKPLGPTDDVPSDPVSIAVALADKLDILVGFWAINEKPTGSKDPFALRRAALGIIRHILENRVRLNLNAQFDFALNQFLKATDAVNLPPTEALANIDDLLSFFHDRLKVYLRDKGIRHDLIDAVITPQSDDLLTITQRAEALQNLITSEEGANLLAGYKRAANILAAEEKKGAIGTSEIDSNLLKEDAEINLNRQLDDVEKQVVVALENEDYSTAMTIMATMRAPIDVFFDSVMVNDDDENVRANRLSLLNRIRNVTGKVADFSKISG